MQRLAEFSLSSSWTFTNNAHPPLPCAQRRGQSFGLDENRRDCQARLFKL